jgi:hypothetical protein
VSFVGNDGGFAGILSFMVTVGAQLDFLMKNKKCHLTRWFEINYEILKSLKFTSQFNGEYCGT